MLPANHKPYEVARAQMQSNKLHTKKTLCHHHCQMVTFQANSKPTETEYVEQFYPISLCAYLDVEIEAWKS
jgi:hypothetical protein